MPEPINIELEMYQRLWAILLANNAWKSLFPEGNRIRFDQVQGDEDPVKSNISDGDLPQIEIYFKRGSTDLYTTDPTFATNAGDGPGEWTEAGDYTIRMVITAQTLHLQELTRLGLITRQVIRAAGPNLGLSYVRSGKLSWVLLDKIDANTERGQESHKYASMVTDLMLRTENSGPTMAGV